MKDTLKRHGHDFYQNLIFRFNNYMYTASILQWHEHPSCSKEI